ncbi:hypothetical protein [Loktanella sp. M215]|uniref:hypothetical protein n=1 Tax=Loktanella sp. M215 TaxID=2675431 RepID=UPI001F310D59|nr:hypothetical protein [Loktanella sp. M215]MCF7699879.1 hypothetical protein [Loktanella sp. M215]
MFKFITVTLLIATIGLLTMVLFENRAQGAMIDVAVTADHASDRIEKSGTIRALDELARICKPGWDT